MRLVPIYRKPKASNPAKGPKSFSIVGMTFGSNDQVWMTNITGLQMQKAIPRCVAVRDQFTRKALDRRFPKVPEAGAVLRR